MGAVVAMLAIVAASGVDDAEAFDIRIVSGDAMRLRPGNARCVRCSRCVEGILDRFDHVCFDGLDDRMLAGEQVLDEAEDRVVDEPVVGHGQGIHFSCSSRMGADIRENNSIL